jgi:hypothetical protein
MVPDSFVVRAKESPPAETSGLPADAPPDADTPAPDRCVLPNVEEELVGALRAIDLAFDVAAMGATPD